MKFACFLLLLLLVSSCKQGNPLEEYTGTWISRSSGGRDINIRTFFYLTLTQEQLENENISFEDNILTISHAEYCTPFLEGKWQFRIRESNDSTLILIPIRPLPRLFRNRMEDHTRPIILKKCKKKSKIKPQAIGVVSYVSDSLNPINSTVDWTEKNIIYRQSLTHPNHTLYPIHLIKECQKRKLQNYEEVMLNDLKKYAFFDTIPPPMGLIGCRFGPFFFEFSFRLNNKNYTMERGLNSSNSDVAIMGLLLSAQKRHVWKNTNKSYHFSSIHEEEKPVPKKLAFVPKVD